MLNSAIFAMLYLIRSFHQISAVCCQAPLQRRTSMEYGSENRDARRDCSGRNKAFPVSRLPLIIGVQTVPDASFAVGIYSWQTGELAQQQCCTKEAGSSWLGYVM